MNGNVIYREIGDDIKKLQAVDTKTSCKACSVIRDALVRSLRIGEETCKNNKFNTILLLILVLSAAKVENVSVVDLLFKILTGGH